MPRGYQHRCSQAEDPCVGVLRTMPKRDITYRDMKAVRFYCEGYDEECKGQLWLPGCQTLRVTFS